MQEIGKVKNRKIKDNIIQIEGKLFGNLPIDSLIKTAILAIIAGYLKTNEIFLNGEHLPNNKFLGDFLSFLLNDRNFAPIKYKIKISNYLEGNVKEKKEDAFLHDYNSVILFSGGFDSSATLLHALDHGWNPLLLWIGFGQKNEEIEERTARKVAKKFHRELLVIKINLSDYIEKGWKDWSYIVPGRNFMFAVFGAAVLAQSKHYRNRIMMGVHEEEFYHSDPGTDKSPYFFEVCSDLFSKFYKKDIKLITPLKHVSKTELAANWKNFWVKKYNIDPHETVSCYYGTNCGACNACLKRSISFMATGLGLDKNIKTNPFEVDEELTVNYIKRCFSIRGHKTQFSKKRAVETLLAYKKSVDYLPKEAKEIIANLSPQLQKDIIKKEKELQTYVWKA